MSAHRRAGPAGALRDALRGAAAFAAVAFSALAAGCGLAGADRAATATEDTMPLLVAHRGASHDAPENTLSSFGLAWQQGADAIEADFFLSRDGEVFCFHDRNAERLAGVDLDVREARWEELTALDVGSWGRFADSRFAGEGIPTLGQVLATVPPGKRIFAEAKAGPEIAEPLLTGLRRSGLENGQITVIAFDAELVAALEALDPALETAWLTSFREDEDRGGWSPTAEEVVRTAQRIGADGVDVQANLEVLDEDFVATVRGAGLGLHAWTVNDPAVAARLRALGVDSITTDRPGWLRQQLTLRDTVE